MNKLYLARHGQSTWNMEGKIQGHTDVILTKNGIVQAKALTKRLKKEKIDYIYTSDLKRALQTANIIGETLNIKIIQTTKLRERNFGAWQGLTSEEVETNYKKEYSIWKSAPHKLIIPGGENLERVQERSLDLVKKLRNKYKDKNILIVTHSVIIKIIILGVLGWDLDNYTNFVVSNCSLSTIDFSNNNIKLSLLNDTHYLT